MRCTLPDKTWKRSDRREAIFGSFQKMKSVMPGNLTREREEGISDIKKSVPLIFDT